MICGFSPWLPIKSVSDLMERTGISLSAMIDYGTGAPKCVEFPTGKGHGRTTTFWGQHRTLKIVGKETERWSTGATTPSLTALISTRGSIQNFREGSNYLDFPVSHLQDAIDQYSQDFGVSNEEDVRVTRVEAGVNVHPKFLPAKFCTEHLLMHKSKRFTLYSERTGPSLGAQCCHADFRLKLYDKGRQYGLPYNLLRYEIAFNRRAVPFISTLADLRNPDNLEKLGALLLSHWNHVVLAAANTDITASIPILDDSLLARSSFGYWEDLRQKVSRATYSKRLREFRQSVTEADGGLHSYLGELFRAKIAELLNQ